MSSGCDRRLASIRTASSGPGPDRYTRPRLFGRTTPANIVQDLVSGGRKPGGGLDAGDRDLGLAGLQVRGFKAGLAFPEEGNLGGAVPRRRELGVLPQASNGHVVLEVLPDARKMLYDRDAEGAQRRLVADTRVHEHLGRVCRGAGEDNFPPDRYAEALALIDKLDAGGAPTVERHFYDLGLRERSEVRPIHVGEGVGAEDRLPSCMSDQYVHDGAAALALHHPSVRAVKGWNSD